MAALLLQLLMALATEVPFGGGLRRWGVNHHIKKAPLPDEAEQISAVASIARVGINWDKVSPYKPPAPPHCTDGMAACYEINYTNTHPFTPACPSCSNGPLQFAGVVGTMGECESLCLGRSNCTSWTWRNGDGSPWAHHCWARSDGNWMPVPNRNDITGRMNRTTLHHTSQQNQQLQYNFSSYDDLLAAQQAVGVDAYWILSCGGSGSSCPDGLAPTTDVQRTAFAGFAVETMAHFAGHGIVWELWNEWIGTSEGAGAPSYAALLNTVGAAVRSDPRIKAEILVGPASSGVNEGFIQELVKADAVRWLDAVSVHPYRSKGPESVLADYDRVRGVIGSSLPIISGEWGWAACANTNGTACACHGGGGSGIAVSDEEQGWLLARQWLVNDLSGVPVSIWYDFKDGGTDRTNGEENYGLVRSEYVNSSLAHVAKPAFHAAQTLQRLFGAQTFSKREISVDNRTTFALQYLLAASDEGASVSNSSSKQASWALWSANPTGVTARAEPLDFLDGCREIFDTFGTRLGEVCPGDGAAAAWNYTSAPRYLVPKLQIDGRSSLSLLDAAWKTDDVSIPLVEPSLAGRMSRPQTPDNTSTRYDSVPPICRGADCHMLSLPPSSFFFGKWTKSFGNISTSEDCVAACLVSPQCQQVTWQTLGDPTMPCADYTILLGAAGGGWPPPAQIKGVTAFIKCFANETTAQQCNHNLPSPPPPPPRPPPALPYTSHFSFYHNDLQETSPFSTFSFAVDDALTPHGITTAASVVETHARFGLQTMWNLEGDIWRGAESTASPLWTRVSPACRPGCLNNATHCPSSLCVLALRADWQTQWATIADQAAPLLRNGSLLGFWLGDELYHQGVLPSELAVVADAVRARFPTAITWTNLCGPYGAPPHGYIPPAEGLIPASMSWVSSECTLPTICLASPLFSILISDPRSL